jgi:hypothetical protein
MQIRPAYPHCALIGIAMLLPACSVAGNDPSGIPKVEPGAYTVEVMIKGIVYNKSGLSPAQQEFLKGFDIPETSRSASTCIKSDEASAFHRSIAQAAGYDCQFDDVKFSNSKGMGKAMCALPPKKSGAPLALDSVIETSQAARTITMIDIYDSSGDPRGNIGTEITIRSTRMGNCES